MPAVIFSGTSVKTLKDNIKIGIQENILLLTGDVDDPSVVAKEAPQGSIYWRSGTSEIWQKLDNGLSLNWARMDGDISGPGASTDNAIMRWNGATGLQAQDSNVLIDDSDNITGANDVTLGNDLTVGNDIIVTGNVDGRDISADGATLDSHLDGTASKHDATEIDYERADGSKVGIDALSDDVESALVDLDDNKLSTAGNNAMASDLDMGTNNITNVGNVDGRDISADGTALDSHLDGGANKHDASEIDVEGSYTTITTTDVESALGELDSSLSAHLDGGANKHDATEVDYERLDGSKIDIQAASDDVETALTDLDDNKLSTAGNNAMASDLDMGTNNITNVGNVDGRDISADGTALDSHLDGGANKHDATEVDYERLDGSKKNIQAASDDVETALTDLDDAIGSLIQGTDYTASNAAIVSSHLQGIDAALSTISSTVNNFEWQDSALDYITDNTLAPPTEVASDRYVLSHDGGAPNAAWDGASAGDVVQFNGTTWDALTPTTGTFIAIDDETDSLRLWTGALWDRKYFEATTASGFLSKSTFDIQLTNLSAQNIILGDGSNVATSVDLSTLGDINGTTAGGLEIKTEVIEDSNISLTAAIQFSKMEDLTVDRALISDGSGDVSVSAVTATELGYLSGVTSALQTQLDAKLDDFTSTNDNRLVRTDGTTGEAVQESLISLDDLGAMSGLTQLDVDNLQLDGNSISSTDVDGDIILNPNGTGDIDASTSIIKNVTDPTNPQDAATKAYVDAATSGLVVNSVSTNTSMSAGEVYLVDTTGGVVQVTLPAPASGAIVRVKDAGGDANTNNITVARNGSEQIDNVAASYVMNSNNEAKTFISDGTDWFIL